MERCDQSQGGGGARGGAQNREFVFHGDQASICKMERVLQTDGSYGHATM